MEILSPIIHVLALFYMVIVALAGLFSVSAIDRYWPDPMVYLTLGIPFAGLLLLI